ncbi:MAG TPA: class I adenylate-forming enzyme family protein [bacterium]|nr:class I adenylate-forming enzyme family protein [bacterium]
MPVRAFPEQPAVIQGDVTVSYRQLDARMQRVAGMLRGLEVPAGSRVALLFPNEWPFVEALFGSMRAGAVPVPLNIRLGYETLRYCVEHSDAEVLVASAALRDLAERLRAETPALRALVVTGDPPPGAFSYDRLLAAAPAEFASAAVAPDDICMQPYTSGSTGRPKGVLLTHAGQYWNAEMVRRVMMLDETDRALVAVPLYHKNAMAAAVKPILMAGGALVVLPGFDPAEVIKAIARHRCTYITGTPAMFRMVLNQKRLLAEYDVTSLRWAACGSAMVPPDLLREFEETFGASISEGYGLTEGGPVVFENPRFGPRKIGSTGLPLPGCEIRVATGDGREAAAGEPGELWTRNPGLARGYYKAPDLTAAKFDRDGWLHTGDLVRADEQGYYYILGRVDDMINVGGENVYPKEVEDLLLLHPAVREAFVVPAPHAVKGEAPVAFVVLHEGRSATADELKQFFLSRGPAYAHPRAVLFVDQAPLGSTGKVDRQVLRRRAVESVGTLKAGGLEEAGGPPPEEGGA